LFGPFVPPHKSAEAAALRHVSDERPGITRRRSGSGFSYTAPTGEVIRDRATLARIRSLAIPPAWTDVWICPTSNGHLQATGRDARRRKQYRYHPRWRQVRDATKFERMVHFGHALPSIRARVEADMSLPGLPRDKVLATVVHLLEITLIRVGNEEYAKANDSYGLTTFRVHHVRVNGTKIRFRFRGKSGKETVINVTNRRIARVVRQCRELPGQDLFQYLDESGEPQPITSSDVNDYLRAASGQDFTAKDFRTWGGTLLAARHLASAPEPATESEAKAAINAAVAAVAHELRNTKAVCRKCYIHPSVLEAFAHAELRQQLRSDEAPPAEGGLSAEEAILLRFLTR
jgi:DNA topoisomerase-1